MIVRWGIVGLGKIANYFVEDLKAIKGCELIAVASRSQKKAYEFAIKYGAKYSYSNYIDLFKNPDVDVVYIATPHTLHCQNTLDALKQHKAVLCEKPLAINAKQVSKMQALARKNNCFLMEALWTDFMPPLNFLKTLNAKKTYGNIKYINAEFCFKPQFNKDNRLFKKDLGGGALLDIGIYPVYLALRLMGKPEIIKAKAKYNETNVDVETTVNLLYKNGSRADLFCSFNRTSDSSAIIEFESAKINIPKRFHEHDKLKIITEKQKVIKDFKHKQRGYNFEIEHVNYCLNHKLKESPEMTFEFSLILIQTLDSIRKLIQLEY